jgi:hypothetical protein
MDLFQVAFLLLCLCQMMHFSNRLRGMVFDHCEDVSKARMRSVLNWKS